MTSIGDRYCPSNCFLVRGTFSTNIFAASYQLAQEIIMMITALLYAFGLSVMAIQPELGILCLCTLAGYHIALPILRIKRFASSLIR